MFCILFSAGFWMKQLCRGYSWVKYTYMLKFLFIFLFITVKKNLLEFLELLELSTSTKLLSKFNTICFSAQIFECNNFAEGTVEWSTHLYKTHSSFLYLLLKQRQTRVAAQRIPPNNNVLHHQTTNYTEKYVTLHSDVKDLYRPWQLPVSAATVTCLNRFPLYQRCHLSEFSEITRVTRSAYLPSAGSRWEIL